MQLIKNYFPEASTDQLLKLNVFAELFIELNSRINLISRNDVNNLEERHILHSLAIAKYYSFSTGLNVADVGTGGGFPGIPLAIMFPKTNFFLIDSIKKKVVAVDEIIQKIELTNVSTICDRVENVDKKFDFIVSRAVTAFPKFLQLTKGKLSSKSSGKISNGIFYLKGGDFTDEIVGLKNVSLINISEYFKEDFFSTKKIIYYSPKL